MTQKERQQRGQREQREQELSLKFKDVIFEINDELLNNNNIVAPGAQKSEITIDQLRRRLPASDRDQVALEQYIAAPGLQQLRQDQSVKSELQQRFNDSTDAIDSLYQREDEENVDKHLQTMHMLQQHHYEDYDERCFMGNADFYTQMLPRQMSLENKSCASFTSKDQLDNYESFKQLYGKQLMGRDSVHPMVTLENFGISLPFRSTVSLSNCQSIEIEGQSSFKGIHPEALQQLRSLKSLSITNCSLKSLSENFGSTLSSLEHLNLSKNKLLEIPSSLFTGPRRSLISVDLSSNDLRELPSSIMDLHKVERLSFNDNWLSSTVFHVEAGQRRGHSDRAFNELQELLLAGNPLTKVFSFDALHTVAPHITSVSIDRSTVSSLQGNVPRTLKVFSCEDGCISDLSTSIDRKTGQTLLQSVERLNLSTKHSSMTFDKMLKFISSLKVSAKDTTIKELSFAIKPLAGALITAKDEQRLAEALPLMNDCHLKELEYKN